MAADSPKQNREMDDDKLDSFILAELGDSVAKLIAIFAKSDRLGIGAMAEIEKLIAAAVAKSGGQGAIRTAIIRKAKESVEQNQIEL